MEKTYYTISEVAGMFHLNQSTLRFWETQFRQLRPHRSTKDTRRYNQSDIDLISTIIYLTDECHLTLDGVRRRLDSNYDADRKRAKAMERLRSIRTELMAIRRELNDHEALAADTIVD
ncbi:MAG: MerR family transcriptional regulator [Candidatus Aphodosoma sp.]